MTRFVLLSLALLVGCGPSLREVHQGDVFYERCYAAEHDRSVADSERQRCWRAWLAEYQLGQPATRVRHARSRIAGLERGDAVAALPGIGETPAEAARRRANTASPPLPASTATESAEALETDEATESDAHDSNAQEASSESEPEELAPADASDPEATESGASPDSANEEDSAAESASSDEPESGRLRSPRRPPVITSHNRSCEPGCQPRWQACADRCEESPCFQSCDAEYRVCMRACIF